MEIPDQYVGYIATAWGGILVWLLNVERRMNARPTRDELDKKLNEMREERKTMHEENKSSLRRIEDKIDAGRPGVLASELERAKEDIQYLRDWKHEKVDPYLPRAVDDLNNRLKRIEDKQ